jgi:hypothetical protein
MAAPLDELLPIVEGTAAAFVLTAAADGARPTAALAHWRMDLQPAAGSAASPLPAWMPPAWAANSSARAIAALGLLEQPAGTAMRLPLGAQMLSLTRVGEAA